MLYIRWIETLLLLLLWEVSGSVFTEQRNLR